MNWSVVFLRLHYASKEFNVFVKTVVFSYIKETKFSLQILKAFVSVFLTLFLTLSVYCASCAAPALTFFVFLLFI